jgi:hypothetical protein
MEISIIRDSIFYYEVSKFSYIFVLSSCNYLYNKIVQTADMKFIIDYPYGNTFFIIDKKYSHFKIINIIALNAFKIIWN